MTWRRETFQSFIPSQRRTSLSSDRPCFPFLHRNRIVINKINNVNSNNIYNSKQHKTKMTISPKQWMFVNWERERERESDLHNLKQSVLQPNTSTSKTIIKLNTESPLSTCCHTGLNQVKCSSELNVAQRLWISSCRCKLRYEFGSPACKIWCQLMRSFIRPLIKIFLHQ